VVSRKFVAEIAHASRGKWPGIAGRQMLECPTSRASGDEMVDPAFLRICASNGPVVRKTSAARAGFRSCLRHPGGRSGSGAEPSPRPTPASVRTRRRPRA
jgi:hypothetical protein